MEERYYAIELEDYSTPPFCSGFTRTYAGTKEMLARFMEKLAQREHFSALVDAYHAWLKDGRIGTVDHDYCQCWNIRPLEVYRITDIDRSDLSITHINTYHYPYDFHADRVQAQILHAKDGGTWCRFVRAAFWQLQCDSLGLGYAPIVMTWGHPAMLERQGVVLSDRLLFQERILDSEGAALRDMDSPAEIDFSGFMKDILGDG